jgi:hypothetical protein
VASDATVVVRGANLPSPDTTIVSVTSEREVELSAPATGSTDGGALVIGQGREADVQAAYRATTARVAASFGCRHVDVYAAWSEAGATGWDAAAAQGRMLDRNHATAAAHRDIAALLLAAVDRPPAPPDGSARILPQVIPGQASVSAPTSGTVELRLPVTLSSPSRHPVTVRWHTRVVDEDLELVQAPCSDYLATDGRVTFAAGETAATVPITVTGNSTGQDEIVVVAFTEPTNARLGGYWGLGIGAITPAEGAR